MNYMPSNFSSLDFTRTARGGHRRRRRRHPRRRKNHDGAVTVNVAR